MTTSEKKLTRRSFLATTALTAGAMASAGMAGCTSVSTEAELSETGEAAEETYAINYCRGNCGGDCPQRATVREGKLVKCMPVAAELGRDYRVSQSRVGCVMGRSTPQRVYATHRVTHPMRQMGERGSDNWEQISWDEAIALVAENFQAAIDECGGSSIAFWRGFGNCTGYLNGVAPSMTCNPYIAPSTSIGFGRFIQKIGATVFAPSSDFASMYCQYVALNIPSNAREDMVNAKTIISIGANSADVIRGDWPMVEARRRGAKMFVLDPVFSKSAAHADVWLPVRPGTDGAIVLAMCNYVIDNDLIDYDYLKNNSVAPLLIKDDLSYLRLSDLGMDPIVIKEGEDPVDTEVVWDPASNSFGSSFEVKDPAIEGSFDAQGIPVRPVYALVKEGIKDFTIQFAADECDVPASMIEEMAEAYAVNKPASLVLGYGFEHYKNSWHMFKSAMLLGSLTGNMGKPGASIAQASKSFMSRYAATNNADAIVEDALPVTGITGEYLPQLMETESWNGESHPIRCVYVLTANPLTNGLGRNELKKALDKVKFVVTADSFMTDTALYSDLVLPVALSWETNDSSALMFTQKAVDPLGECKQDIDIFRAIADKMGIGDLYSKTNEEYLRAYLDTEENLAEGVGYDVASESGVVGNPEFATGVGVETNPTARSQFFLPVLVPRDTVDWQPREVDHYPWYEPAHEAYQTNPLRETYPLYGVSCHHLYWTHSLFKGIPWLDELRGDPTVLVHEETAAARGIKAGDVVRVFNDHGYVVLKAVVTQGIRPDTLMLPHGPEGDDFIDGHTQALSSVVLDEMTSNNNFNDFVCEIEKYQGGVE